MRYQFLDFTFDPVARELRRGSEPVHLSGKSFDLLLLLIEQRPRALQKHEIYDRLWPETYVAEANLPVLIREIRTAIGDEKRKLIRTVHGFGYAFAAGVRQIERPSDDRATGLAHILVHADRPFRLATGENIVGRDPSAAIFIPSSTVSRHHALITTDVMTATVADLGSKNGTRIDGSLIQSATPLRDGCVVRFGSIEMVYRCCDPSGATESVRASLIVTAAKNRDSRQS